MADNLAKIDYSEIDRVIAELTRASAGMKAKLAARGLTVE